MWFQSDLLCGVSGSLTPVQPRGHGNDHTVASDAIALRAALEVRLLVRGRVIPLA